MVIWGLLKYTWSFGWRAQVFKVGKHLEYLIIEEKLRFEDLLLDFIAEKISLIYSGI